MVIQISRFVSSMVWVLVLSACVSIDSRVWNEHIDKEATRRISGTFSNQASYRSTGEFLARDNLADLLNVAVHLADRVRISGDPTETLTITWLDGDVEKVSRVYSRDFGLSIASDGSIDLPSKGHWTSGEGAFGYQARHVRLFLTANGDLATIQTGGGVGSLGPIPIGVYAKHLAIFPRR